jgi:predicted DNA-binding transcriptional regulator YafY
MEYRGARNRKSRRLERALWVLCYAQRYGRISNRIALQSGGIPCRSFYRAITDLRAAGLRFIVKPDSAHAEGRQTLHFAGFDEAFAETVREAAA